MTPAWEQGFIEGNIIYGPAEDHDDLLIIARAIAENVESLSGVGRCPD